MSRLFLLMVVLMLLAVVRAGDAYAVSPVGVVRTTQPLHVARSLHTATVLLDGRVLIAGGMVSEGRGLDSAELFDPDTESFKLTGNLRSRRLEHSATLLMDGRVLIAGGWDRNVLDTAELFDPESGTFSETGQMTTPRSGFTATRLQNGTVLFTGGYDNRTRQFLSSAEIYDPDTGVFAAVGAMHSARLAHTAILLNDGSVLIAGGGTFDDVWDTAERYDPQTGTFTSAGNLLAPRYKHAAALLPDGDVLILGGADQQDWTGQYTSAEVYDLEADRFIPAATLEGERFKLRDAVTVLANGHILVAGGNALVEVYDPQMDVFHAIEGMLDESLFYSTAVTLNDGLALITGGYTHGISSTARAWLFIPDEMP